MLSIYATTKYHQEILDIVHLEDRLIELVSVVDILKEAPIPDTYSILVTKGEIDFPLDWRNTQPPFLLPEKIELNASNLLGVIFSKLANYVKAYQYLHNSNPSLFQELDFVNRLKQGIHVRPEELISQYTPYEDYRLMHNNAILRHYSPGGDEFNMSKVIYFYNEALASPPSEEYLAYTAKHLAQLLIDAGLPTDATGVLNKIKLRQLSSEANIEIKNTMCQAWMQQLTVPYDQELLSQLKSTLWEVLEFYEGKNRKIEHGLLLLDASHIANISESFTESLGYATKAIRIFDEEKQHELVGNAQYRKGTLLYTWAQQSNPQFFKPAIEAYQEALKVFTKEAAPHLFADIHHNLGVLYTDMPTEHKKKSIWAGVAVSSFDEALSYYSKSDFPYQYAMICNNYGNAYTKFPKAVLSDNYEKALFFYQEALDIRTSDYPTERAITLLNFLEASWDVGNDPDKFNEERYHDMIDKACEIKDLVNDEEMIAHADKHLNLLEDLKKAVSI